MIKIVKPEDLKKIENTDICIYPYIRDQLFHILNEYARYSPNLSIEDEIGAIFLLEGEEDWLLYQDMELSSPVQETRFEWIEQIECGCGYCNGCIVIVT